jgi:hypothetical protein
VEKIRNEESSRNPEGRKKKSKAKHRNTELKEVVFDRHGKGKKKVIPDVRDDSSDGETEDD